MDKLIAVAMGLITILPFLFIAGCTPEGFTSRSDYGKESQISCFSGGKEIFSTKTATKVSVSPSGVRFANSQGEFNYIQADCIVIKNN